MIVAGETSEHYLTVKATGERRTVEVYSEAFAYHHAVLSLAENERVVGVEHTSAGQRYVWIVREGASKPPAVEVFAKGDRWRSPSSVVYEVTSVRGGKVYGRQILGEFRNGAKRFGAVTALNIPTGATPESKGGA